MTQRSTFNGGTIKLIRLILAVVALCLTSAGAIYGTYQGATAHADQRIKELQESFKEDYGKIEVEQKEQRKQIHEIDKKTDRILTIVEERLGPPRTRANN
jgi:uncharacterized membrane protein|tara:strand:- start:973 stop:1272 length:300 start_codon:yes stop_codon:yes gene_type:complete